MKTTLTLRAAAAVRAAGARSVVAHLLTAAALSAGLAISVLPPLQAAPAPAAQAVEPAVEQAAGQWPAPQAPFDDTPIGPPESAGASRDV